MDWKLFAYTFALIFVAELGDKTQLAALAATAGCRSPVSVFLGASCALVLSTLIAVAVGSAMQRVVPPQVLKAAAGALFLVFGVLLLWSAGHRSGDAAPTGIVPAGALSRLVLKTASEFERASSADYRTLAGNTEDAALRELLLALAADEDAHLHDLHDSLADHEHTPWEDQVLRPVEAMAPSVAAIDEATARVLDEAIDHEQATASFYAELAQSAPLPALRHTFARLAEEERRHARRLTEFRDRA